VNQIGSQGLKQNSEYFTNLNNNTRNYLSRNNTNNLEKANIPRLDLRNGNPPTPNGKTPVSAHASSRDRSTDCTSSNTNREYKKYMTAPRGTSYDQNFRTPNQSTNFTEQIRTPGPHFGTPHSINLADNASPNITDNSMNDLSTDRVNQHVTYGRDSLTSKLHSRLGFGTRMSGQASTKEYGSIPKPNYDKPQPMYSPLGRDSSQSSMKAGLQRSDKIPNPDSRFGETTQGSQSYFAVRGVSSQSNHRTLEAKLEQLRAEVNRLNLTVEREGLRTFTLRSMITELNRITSVEKSHEYVQGLSKLIHHLKVKKERYHNELHHYTTLIDNLATNNKNIEEEIEILRTKAKTLRIKGKLYEETMFIRRDRLDENSKLKSANNTNLNLASRKVYK